MKTTSVNQLNLKMHAALFLSTLAFSLVMGLPTEPLENTTIEPLENMAIEPSDNGAMISGSAFSSTVIESSGTYLKSKSKSVCSILVSFLLNLWKLCFPEKQSLCNWNSERSSQGKLQRWGKPSCFGTNFINFSCFFQAISFFSIANCVLEWMLVESSKINAKTPISTTMENHAKPVSSRKANIACELLFWKRHSKNEWECKHLSAINIFTLLLSSVSFSCNTGSKLLQHL